MCAATRFYFDPTHKGNDWNAVKSRLSADIKTGKKSESAATKEMLALLNDKYTRCAESEEGESGPGFGEGVCPWWHVALVRP